MIVVFGREAEKTRGRIVAVNQVRAKVESMEARSGRPTGTRFNVPYFLMSSAEDHQAPAT